MLPFALLPLGLAAPSRLDQANRCSPLPARPATARIVHSGLPAASHALPASWKGVVAQLQVGDSLIVAAPVGLALRPSCRQLARELGEVSAIELVGGSGPAVHVWRWLIAASYAGVAVGAAAPDAAAPDATEGSSDAAYWDVLFTHGQLRRCSARLLTSCFRAACRVPVAGAVVRAAQAIVVRWMRTQLTPTEPPPLLLRLLPRLPWRAQRLAARAWVQAELPDRRSRPA